MYILSKCLIKCTATPPLALVSGFLSSFQSDQLRYLGGTSSAHTFIHIYVFELVLVVVLIDAQIVLQPVGAYSGCLLRVLLI